MPSATPSPGCRAAGALLACALLLAAPLPLVQAVSLDVAVPAASASASDGVWAHFPMPGARVTLVSPEGAPMTILYEPVGHLDCALPVFLPPDALDCFVSAVAHVDLSGRVVSARRAHEPDVPVSAASFHVACSPRVAGAPSPAFVGGLEPRACLDGVAADGTWTLALPVDHRARATGARLEIAGKTLDDVAPVGGDVTTNGSAAFSRDATSVVRSWNWHLQTEPAHQACSGGLVAPCPTDGGPKEGVSHRRHLAPALLADPDGDGVATPDELAGRSDPLDLCRPGPYRPVAACASTPEGDEDADGVATRDERTPLHADGTMANARVVTQPGDGAWVHFGLLGASAVLVSPEGHAMTMTYAPAALPAPSVVAHVDVAGRVLSARVATGPQAGEPVTLMWVRVACARPSCVEGVGADGTWTFLPARNARGLESGSMLHLAGKTFADLSPASGDIAAGGSGESSRSATWTWRLWNWHEQREADAQAEGSTILFWPGGREESYDRARWYV